MIGINMDEGFKDIQISPILNLESSFEGVKDSSGNMGASELECASQEEEEGVDDLGLMDNTDVLEVRNIEKTLVVNNKPNSGEKKKRGAKSTKMKLALAGSATNQRKLLRLENGYSLS